MMNFKIILLTFLIVTVLIFVSCNEKKEELPYNLSIDGELFGFYWESTKKTQTDFYYDYSKDSFLLENGLMLRPEKCLKVDVIDESKMNGKTVLQAINHVKSKYEIIQQGIYFYIKDDTLSFYGFLLSLKVPHYLDMVDILFYFDEEFILGDKRKYFRHEIISDSCEIKRISNILANEYKYEILQRTFISSKE